VSISICNFLFVDVDSSKLDLSKELGNDFSSPFDSLLDPVDLQLNTDDFVSENLFFCFIILLYHSVAQRG
jgi:hypothetical protein